MFSEVEKNCLFLSAHLDDVALSCASLIASLVKHRHEVMVATIFTRAVEGGNTGFTKEFLLSCGFDDQMLSLKEWKNEDRRAWRFLGCNAKHLGFILACWRQKTSLNRTEAILSKILPSATFLYPSSKKIFSGKIMDSEDYLNEIRQKVEKLAGAMPRFSLFLPLGAGGHVDHLITRKIGESLTNKAVYYEDFPYNYDFTERAEKKSLVEKIVRGESLSLVWEEKKYREQKIKAISLYQSQCRSLFSQGIPFVPERYYQEKCPV